MVRTRTVGYLRDVRRLTVALSRARLGLYILGRLDVFASCFELKPAFDILSQRPNKLNLVHGEMFPTNRLLESEVEGTLMENVEHIGQYVFEMTQAKLKGMGAEQLIDKPFSADVTGDNADVDLLGEDDDDADLTLQQDV